MITSTVAVLVLTGCGADGAAHRAASRASSPSAAASVPSTTRANRLVIPDQAHDVELSLNEGDDDPRHVRDPRVDLREVVVTYAKASVRVRERIADLRPVGFQQIIVQLHGPGVTLTGYAVINDGPQVSLDWELRGRRSAPLKTQCAGPSARADYVNDAFTLTMPNACLGTPPWVRVSASSSFLETDDAQYDDALDRDQIGADGYSARVDRPQP